MDEGHVPYSEDARLFWLGAFGQDRLWYDYERAASAIVRKSKERKQPISPMKARWLVLQAHAANPDWRDHLFQAGWLDAEDARIVEPHVRSDNILMRLPESMKDEDTEHHTNH